MLLGTAGRCQSLREHDLIRCDEAREVGADQAAASVAGEGVGADAPSRVHAL